MDSLLAQCRVLVCDMLGAMKRARREPQASFDDCHSFNDTHFAAEGIDIHFNWMGTRFSLVTNWVDIPVIYRSFEFKESMLTGQTV